MATPQHGVPPGASPLCSYHVMLRRSESGAEEFVLVRAGDGKAEYLHIGRHALKKVQPRK